MYGAPGTVGVCGTASYAYPCVPLPSGISVTVGSAAALDAATALAANSIVVVASITLLIRCQPCLLTAPPCSDRVPQPSCERALRRTIVAFQLGMYNTRLPDWSTLPKAIPPPRSAGGRAVDGTHAE